MKIKLYAAAREQDKKEALRVARERTERENKKFVVRDGHDVFYVCPLYAEGKEGVKKDVGYESLGELVKESL